MQRVPSWTVGGAVLDTQPKTGRFASLQVIVNNYLLLDVLVADCTCTNGQGPPPAAKRPGCGDPPCRYAPGGLNFGALHGDGCPRTFPHPSEQSAKLWMSPALPVRPGEDARKVVPCKAAPLT